MFRFFTRRSKSISQAALVLACFTFAAQLLSLLRDRLFAGQVGAGLELDTYYYAFRIPDILYAVFSALVSLTVIIPLLSKHKDTETEEMKNTYSILFTVFCGASSLVILIVFFLMPQLVHYVAPGVEDGAVLNNIVLYSRILLLQPFFLGISNLLGSYTQLKERFLLYACSPFIYNLCTVLGLVFLYPKFGMMGVVMGVVFGSILHGVIQIPFIRKENFLPTFKRINKKEWEVVKQVITQSIPRAVILSLVQVELLFLNSLASHMSAGNTSLLNLATNLQGVPVTLIGLSLVLASFPSLSKAHANEDMAEFKKVFNKTFATILLWATTATVVLFIFKKYIIFVLLGTQSFDPESFRIIVNAFGIFVLALVPQCLKMLITRGYYACGDTRKPALLNVFGTILSVTLAYTFYTYVGAGSSSNITILVMAYATSAWVSCTIFYFSLTRSVFKF